jgi:pimeloyl-ACP methyl ester carboxylesterase
MAYKQFVPLVHPNFQFNRVLAHGKDACREEELWEIAPRLGHFNFMNWHKEWRGLAARAESEGRLMHAAYYHRMSEFFLPDGRPEKPKAYQDFRRCFYQTAGGEPFEHFEVPYQGAHLPAMRLRAAHEKGVILLHGGYDSFMEEFYLQVKNMVEKGYTFVVFEGPGQGRTLQDGLKMTPEWEKPVSAVLDFFKLQAVTLVGISLGGYLALRAAAFEPRIQHVVAYDVVYDAFTCFTDHMPEPVRSRFRQMVKAGQRQEINGIAESLRAKDDLLDWALTHGMYITGTSDPFAYFKGWTAFSTEGFSRLITQDVLVLAGENDHLVPLDMYYKQKEALVNARSVRGRIFTASEGGDQHCQVGNLDLAWQEILDWLNEFNA